MKWGSLEEKKPKTCRKEIDKLQLKLEERKVIEKAKGILAKENNISEEEAYQMLRALSMNKRARMSDIAELIIMDDE